MSDPNQPQQYPGQQPHSTQPMQPPPAQTYPPPPGYPPPGTYGPPPSPAAAPRAPRSPADERRLYGLIVLIAGWIAAGAAVLAAILALAESGGDGTLKLRNALNILSNVAFAALALTAGVWLRTPRDR
jgi:hypothetical protein